MAGLGCCCDEETTTTTTPATALQPKAQPAPALLSPSLNQKKKIVKLGMLIRCVALAAARSGAWLLGLLLLPLLASALEYHYRSYGEIVEVFQGLQTQYPGLVDMYSAQERYQLPSPGDCTDSAGQPVPCFEAPIASKDTQQHS